MMDALYALLGLIAGAFFSLLAVAGTFAARGDEGAAALFFGAGAIIVLPILYGILGFIGGVIIAALYNVVASVAGGIELDLEYAAMPAYPISEA